ncbi:MAG: LSU ribosomal protein L18p (L5e), partial [uncultured Solirubrobacteraceae bacterium]
ERQDQAPGTSQAPPPRPREDHRDRRAAAHLRLSLQPRDRRAARRRHRRPHAGRRRVDGGAAARQGAAGAGLGRRQAAGRARAGRGRVRRGVRSRRIPVPRPCQGLRRGRPRRRTHRM